MTLRLKHNVGVPESLGGGQTVIDPITFQTTLTTTDDRTIAAGGDRVIKLIRNRSGGNCQITFSPRLRGAASDISTISDGDDMLVWYQEREDDTDRWLDIGGDYTKS